MTRLFRALRITGLLLAGGALVTAAAVFVLSERRLDRRYPVVVASVGVRHDSAGIARGRHLYRTITCATCHGADGGGAVYANAGAIGFLAGPNLTRGRGGVAPQRTDADWVRAIRHGVRSDSTSLLVMPSEVFAYLTDADLRAIVGYLRQLPDVDRELPPSRLRWLGRTLLVAGRLELLVASKTPVLLSRPAVAEGATIEYGRYLADISGCHGCHGFGLSGGRVAGPPGLPPASNLTPSGLTGWTAGYFAQVMRSGRRRDGSTMNDFMPWREFRHMSDTDLTALWLYLQSVPAKPFGLK